MPLWKDIGKNIRELKKDNLKKGKAKGAGWKSRSMEQIKAIALNAAWKKKTSKK